MNGVINTIRKKALKTPSIHRISLPVSGETKRPSHRGKPVFASYQAGGRLSAAGLIVTYPPPKKTPILFT